MRIPLIEFLFVGILKKICKKDYFKSGSDFELMIVPNVVNISYGRVVGYVFEEEIFDKSITEFNANKNQEAIEGKGQTLAHLLILVINYIL